MRDEAKSKDKENSSTVSSNDASENFGFMNDDDSSSSSSDQSSNFSYTEHYLRNKKYADGYFHPEHLETLFSFHSDTLKIVQVERLSSTSFVFPKVLQSHVCVIAYRSYDYFSKDATRLNSQNVRNEYYDDHNNKWELRSITLFNDKPPYGPLARSKWAGKIFVRHGNCFPGWWKIESEKACPLEMEADANGMPLDVSVGLWSFLCFVKISTKNEDDVKRDFLSTLGGQSLVTCGFHNFPLVVCSRKDKALCSDSEICKKKSCYQCPLNGCVVSLCPQHFEQAYEEVKISGGTKKIWPASHVSAENSEDDSSSNMYSSFSDDHSSVNSSNTFSEDEESESSSIWKISNDNDDPCNVQNNAFDDLRVNDVDCDSFGDDLLDNSSNDDTDHGVPTTTVGLAPIAVENVNNGQYIPAHCIMNNCGNLLCRKQSKLKGTKHQQGFLQSIVAKCNNRPVPLLYPEAMLFPSIFWKNMPDTSILGAIPCGMMTDAKKLNSLNLECIEKQTLSRVMNTALLTSTDDRYLCYAFDTMVNLSCRKNDTRVILHRGFGATAEGVGIKGNNDDTKSVFNTDSVDSRPVVNKLSAAFADSDAQYFATFSVNQLDHFGISEIKKWIDSPELKIKVGSLFGKVSELSPLEKDPLPEYSKAYSEFMGSINRMGSIVLLRNWMEVSEIWMTYLLKSLEKPLGDVWRIWWRHEYQDTMGNLSHIHALLWCLKAAEDLKVMLDRIRAMTLDLVRQEELDELIDQGFLEDVNEVNSVIEKAGKVLLHVCSYRCVNRIGPEEHDITCRAVKNFIETSDPFHHVFSDINVTHSKAAMDILEKLNLFIRDPTTGRMVAGHYKLKAEKHYPPSRKYDGTLSACSGKLFCATRSNQNLKFLSGYFGPRYVTKYVGSIDENNKVYIGAVPKDENKIVIDKVDLANTKITGSAINEKHREAARKDKKHPSARAISLMEMVSVILGYDQVYSNIDFVHVSTVPMAERSAVVRSPYINRYNKKEIEEGRSAVYQPKDIDSGRAIIAYKIRNIEMINMHIWRTLSNAETMIVKDLAFSPFSVDKITLFGLRPPELRFVRNPIVYFRWFFYGTRVDNAAKAETLIRNRINQHELMLTFWYDSLNSPVYLRLGALNELIQYILSVNERDFYANDHAVPLVSENALVNVSNFLHTLQQMLSNPLTPQHSQYGYQEKVFDCFFGSLTTREKNKVVPVVWTSNVPPSQPHRWMVHVLLTMGKFDNEFSLMITGSFRNAFLVAGLVSTLQDTATLLREIEDILRKYLLSQLIYIPGGTPTFDRFVVSATRILHKSLTQDSLPCEEYPPCLYTKMKTGIDVEVTSFLTQEKKRLLTCLLNDLTSKGITGFPLLETVLGLNQGILFDWNFTMTQSVNQPLSSFEEQMRSLHLANEQLHSYRNPGNETHTKGVVFVGGPGVGKTTLLQTVGVLAHTQGLNVSLTAMMAERARQLGGSHIAQLFMIPVRERCPPVKLAELAILRLNRCPKALAIIQTLDVLLLDEMGQVPAELLSCIDIICRFVRKSNLPFAGILVIATIDWLQLKPVDGQPPLLSPFMMSCFMFKMLSESVRASKDDNLKEIQSITRIPAVQLTDNHILRFRHLIENCCTFVSRWDDPLLTPDKMRLFGKKEAARKEEDRMLRAMKNRFPTQNISRDAEDLESTVEGLWVTASKLTSVGLSKKIKEPRRLNFFPGAQYEVTFNHDKGFHSQGQLAVLFSVPTAEQLQLFLPIKVYLAPEGCKNAPTSLLSSQEFLDLGWKIVEVGLCPDRSQTLKYGIQAKRRQYGLRHRIASTIHAGMGQDLRYVVTRVTSFVEDPAYALWEKEQIVVLLSRTNFAVDLIFVGDKEKTSAALASLLLKSSQFSSFTEYMLKKVCGQTRIEPIVPVIEQKHHPFRSKDIDLPKGNVGFVYMLLSMKDFQTFYIGQTKDLSTRLRSHNAGFGSSSTCSEFLRPWAIFGYITGFVNNTKPEREKLEAEWKHCVARRKRQTGSITADEAFDTIVQILQQSGRVRMICVKCGTTMPRSVEYNTT